MRINNKWLLSALVLAIMTVFIVTSVHATGRDGGYVGTSVCLSCHDGSPAADKTSFTKTGHPWKYKHTGGTTPPNAWDPISALFPRPNTANPGAGGDISTTSLNNLIVDDGTGKLAWSSINYTIGGYGWKIRWGVRDFDQDGDGINETGYVWAGPKAQYNTENGSWSQYPGTVPSNKKNECANCHQTNGIVSTTGYSCYTDGGTNAAPARTEPWASNPGMGPESSTRGGYYSSWTWDGVQCEACHGKGSNASNNGHADTGAGSQGVLTLAGGVEICAKCHIRAENTSGQGAECGGDANPAILTNGAKISDPFINHHEQYNEIQGLNGDGAHASLTCTTCHDPHKRAAGVIPAVATALGIAGDNTKPEVGAMKKQCSDCHWAQDADGAANIAGHAGVTCVDCHMAEATKTATSSSTAGWGRKGDLKTHIFKINAAGSSIVRSNGFTNVAQNYITPKYACGKCHDSNIYGSSISGPTSEATAQTAAANYHNVAALTTPIDGGYVGSEICSTCHVQKYDDFAQSGHPYKLRFTLGATPDSTDPLSALLTSSGNNTIAVIAALNADATSLPTTQTDLDSDGKLDWSSVEYVIGGYGWKARWGIKDTSGNDKTGYVWSAASLVGGFGAQFNMLAADPALDPSSKRSDWSTYGSATGQSKKYECATCHNTNGAVTTTGYDCVQTAGARTEPAASTGLALSTDHYGGFYSEWTFSGVQCEACHGPAATHVSSRLASDVVKDTSKDVCGKCHMRAENTNKTGAVSNAECGGPNAGPSVANYLANGAKIGGNYINHHEQYNEMVGLNDGVHRTLNCVDCHDPHKRSHKVTNAIAGALGITDNALSAEARGAVVSCESCHGSKTLRYPMANVTCIDCHMAEATQSATNETGTWGKMGDVKTHVFKVSPSATTITRQNGQPTPVNVVTNALSVDYACGKCHDSTMSTKVNFTFTQAQARTYAVNMHSNFTADFTWGVDAVTSNKVNFSASGCPAGDVCTYAWNFGDAATGTGLTTSHTYADTTARTVGLTITDTTTSKTASVSKTVTPVHLNTAPVATRTALSVSGFTVTFTDSSTDAEDAQAALTIKVNWGDGTPVVSQAGGSVFTHTYTKAGSYVIAHKAKDTGGLVKSSWFMKDTDKNPATPDIKVYSESVTVPAKYTVSGSVVRLNGTTPIAGVSLRLMVGGVVKKMTTTNTLGNYTFTGVVPNNYTVKAVKTGYIFVDGSANVTNANVTGVNFTANK